LVAIATPDAFREGYGMRATDIQQIGNELAMKWDNGAENYITLEALRRHCPCAACKGEVDALGQLHKGPEIPLNTLSFQLRRLAFVGGYGVQPYWADGHSTGIYSFDLLRKIATA
jgi:DUF971 family protein